jgi:hypothetical protein
MRKANRHRVRIFSKGLWTKIPKVLEDKFWSLPLEERVKLAPQFAEVAKSLGLTDDGEAAIALVSEDCKFVVTQTTKLSRDINRHKRLIARCSDLLMESHLNRQIHGCGSNSAYLRHVDSRIGMCSSSFAFSASVGKGDRLFSGELRAGVDGEPGVDDDFINKSLSKLTVYGKVRDARGPKEALRGFKTLGFEAFRRLQYSAEPYVTVKAASAAAKQAKRLAEKSVDASSRRDLPAPLDAGPKSPFELTIRRIITRGGIVHILSSTLPDALAISESKLAEWRAFIDEANRQHFRSEYAIGAEDGILKSRVALDIEDYIRKSFADMAANRRTLAILVARLRDEPFFYQRWHHKHNSFARYAREVLGIGEELRDLLRIGRNLLRFPCFLEGQVGFDTDICFYSLRYLDQAMANHGSKVELIRTRLKTLSSREFAEFARDPQYDQCGSLRRLSSKKEARVVELLAEVNNLIAQGRTVRVIEILAESERGQAALLLAEAERALEAQIMVEAPAQESLAEAISTDVTSTDAPTSSGQESTRPLPGDEESSDLLAA